MPDLPKPKDDGAPKRKDESAADRTGRRPDRTGTIVAAGLTLLALIGVGTIFADPIRAALAPAPPTGAEAVTAAPAGPTPAASPTPAPAAAGAAAPVAPAAPIPAASDAGSP